MKERGKDGKFKTTNSNGYSAIHKWLVKNFGNPVSCEQCHKVGERVNGKWNIEWANISGEYHRLRSDFIGLCTSCHSTHDGIVKNIKKMRDKVI